MASSDQKASGFGFRILGFGFRILGFGFRGGRLGPIRVQGSGLFPQASGFTYSLHCSSFLGLPFRIPNLELVKPKTPTMETIGRGLVALLQQVC